MLKNENESKNKLLEEYEDALFRLVMHQAAEQEGKLYMKEMEELKSNPENTPSAEDRLKFIKFLDNRLRQKTKDGNRRHSRRLLKKGATVFAAIIVVFSVLMVTVSAFRIQVFNIVLEINEKYTAFQLKDSTDNSTANYMIVDWKNAYAPTYSPDGYEVGAIYNTDNMKSITFINLEDDRLNIVYTEYDTTSNIEIDTQTAQRVETVDINGNKGTLIMKEDLVTLAWTMDNKLFTVIGQADAAVIKQIADSVTFVK